LWSNCQAASGEGEHAVVFRAVTHLAEAGVIAILLSSPGIAAGRLNMAIGLGADPNVGPGGRDSQCLDALEGGGVADLSAGCLIGEGVTGAAPADARLLVADIGQPGVFGRVFGGNNSLSGGQIEYADLHSIGLAASASNTVGNGKVSLWAHTKRGGRRDHRPRYCKGPSDLRVAMLNRRAR
jgi:hypothetical protein